LQERIAQGYEGDVGALWDVAQQQNAEAAALRWLGLLSIHPCPGQPGKAPTTFFNPCP